MAFEMLDGFLTSLVIGPALVLPSEYLPEIWGTADGAGPEWDSTEQMQYFMTLLTKHWNAIAERRNSGGPIQPYILPFGSEATRASEWADGFEVGIELREATSIAMSTGAASSGTTTGVVMAGALHCWERRARQSLRRRMQLRRL